jgi:cytosine deaminase
MLVLSRQRDQSVIIGEDTEVRVVDVRGDKVRLGFIAPRDVSVHRKEVFDQIRRENRDAAKLKPEDLVGAGPPAAAAGPSMRLVAPPDPAHEPFLRAALAEARQSLADGGVPIGAVLVRDGQVIARGGDLTVQRGDPTAHAEVVCLAAAGRNRGALAASTLYSTLMPCHLCSGAVIELGIPRVVIGDSISYSGRQRSGVTCPGLLASHGVELIDLADAESIELMRAFIREHPERWM